MTAAILRFGQCRWFNLDQSQCQNPASSGATYHGIRFRCCPKHAAHIARLNRIAKARKERSAG